MLLTDKLTKISNSLRRPFNNKRGIALLLAVTTLALISYLAMEVMYDSNVEYVVNSQAVNRIKAYYAARSGLELSLLRIKIYNTVQTKLGKNLPQNGMIEKIWQFPFAWPFPIPPEVNAVDKDNMQKLVKESSMDASFITTIEDEGSKIDLNDLVSKSETLRNSAHKQLKDIFDSKIKDNEEFQQKYGSFRFDELINNIADWMSDKNSSFNGGDKKSRYSDYGTDQLPPNRGFRTVQELRLVAGMTDELYELLEPRVTIYGMKGINPNSASKEVIRAIDPGITDEIADAVIARRDNTATGGPFKDRNDFVSFVTSKGAKLEERDTEKLPLVFDSLYSFRIRSTGEYNGASREIIAIVTDINKSAKTVKGYLDKEKQQSQPNPDKKTTTNPQNQPEVLPKGPPRIVYWNEK